MNKEKPYRQGIGIILLNKQGLVFAGCRADRAEDAWQLPQGGMEPDESRVTAAFRELKEEIGCDNAEVIVELQTITHYDYPLEAQETKRGRKYRGQEHRWVLMRFVGDDAEIDLGKSHGEFRDWKWMAPRELLNQVVSFRYPAYEAVFQETLSMLHRWHDDGKSRN